MIEIIPEENEVPDVTEELALSASRIIKGYVQNIGVNCKKCVYKQNNLCKEFLSCPICWDI